MRYLLMSLLVLAAVAVWPAGAGSSPATSAAPILPAGVRAQLNSSYPGWKLGTVAMGCSASYKNSSVSGDFDGNGRRDYVVKFSRGNRGYLVAFLDRGRAGYASHVLTTTTLAELKTLGLSIDRKGARYPIGDDESDGRTARLPNDAPLVGVCESESCHFIYRNGKFSCGGR